MQSRYACTKFARQGQASDHYSCEAGKSVRSTQLWSGSHESCSSPTLSKSRQCWTQKPKVREAAHQASASAHTVMNTVQNAGSKSLSNLQFRTSKKVIYSVGLHFEVAPKQCLKATLCT